MVLPFRARTISPRLFSTASRDSQKGFHLFFAQALTIEDINLNGQSGEVLPDLLGPNRWRQAIGRLIRSRAREQNGGTDRSGPIDPEPRAERPTPSVSVPALHLHLQDRQPTPHSIQTSLLSSLTSRLKLSALEKLGLIERLPHDRIRFMVSKKVAWRKDGPLRQQFLSEAKQEFLGSNFTERPSVFQLLQVQLTQKTATELIEVLNRKSTDLRHVSELEKTVEPELESFGVLLAVRPWSFSKLSRLTD